MILNSKGKSVVNFFFVVNFSFLWNEVREKLGSSNFNYFEIDLFLIVSLVW